MKTTDKMDRAALNLRRLDKCPRNAQRSRRKVYWVRRFNDVNGKAVRRSEAAQS